MNRKAAAIVDEHSESLKDALSLLAIGFIGVLSNFVSGLVEENAIYANMANLVTILSFTAAVIRTGFIFLDWKERRKMIAIKKKVREEELAAVEVERERSKRLEKNMNDLLYAPTADEIAEILARNARDKGDE